MSNTVIRVLKCPPEEFPDKYIPFRNAVLYEINKTEGDIFFYLLRKVEHDGEYHYFTFVWDKYGD